MPFRVTSPLVLAKDQHGLTHHKYQGEIINWLSDDQRADWLVLGLVEEIGTPDIGATDLAGGRIRQQAANAEAERVRRCLDALNELEVPLGNGRPAVRAALEERGLRFSNETIAGAIKQRRELSRTPGMPACPVSEEMARP